MTDKDEVHALARDLYAQARGDAQRLATLAAQFKLAAQGRKGQALEIQPGVSFETGQPFVQLYWGEQRGQLTPDETRQHALLLLEAAGNAIMDAALLAFGTLELGLDTERGARLIDGLRTFRADRWGQPDLTLEFDRPAPEEPE